MMAAALQERMRKPCGSNAAASSRCVTPGSYGSDDLAVMPNRLIAAGISIRSGDRKGHQPQATAAILVGGGRRAPDEVAFPKIDKTPECRLVRAVNRPIFACPGSEALFEPHGVQCARADRPHPMSVPGRDERIIKRALIVIRDPDFVAEIAGEGNAANQRRY